MDLSEPIAGIVAPPPSEFDVKVKILGSVELKKLLRRILLYAFHGIILVLIYVLG